MNETIKRTLSIIPNEKILDVPIFHDISYDDCHEEMLKRFIIANDLEDVENKYDLFLKGCIVLTTADDEIICEVPENISDKQYECLVKLRNFISGFKVFASGIICDEMIMIDHVPEGYSKTVIDYFYEVVKEKCLKEGRKP